VEVAICERLKRLKLARFEIREKKGMERRRVCGVVDYEQVWKN